MIRSTVHEALYEKMWKNWFYICLDSADIKYYEIIPDRYITDNMISDDAIEVYYSLFWNRWWDSRKAHTFFDWLSNFNKRKA